MNPLDILGAILKRRSQSQGGRVVKDVVESQQRPAPRPAPERSPRRRAEYEPQSDYRVPEEGAEELDDLLREAFVNFDRQTQGQYRDALPKELPGGRRESRPEPRSTRPEPRSTRSPQPREFPEPRSFDDRREHRDRQAEVLIRAMVLAARADGRIDQQEQEQIASQMGGGRLSQEDVEYLREEFRREIDLRTFVRSVPRGLERHVYSVSLMAIDFDSNPESKHLHELAQCLGLEPEDCNQIHRQFNVPTLY